MTMRSGLIAAKCQLRVGRSPGAESAVGSRYERLREIPTPALRATPTRTFDLESRGDDRRRAMDGKRSGIAGGQIEMSERPFRRIVVGQGDETRSSAARYGDLPRRECATHAARPEIRLPSPPMMGESLHPLSLPEPAQRLQLRSRAG